MPARLLQSLAWAVVSAALLVCAGCGGGGAASARLPALHRASRAARAKQQAGLDAYLNDHLRPLLIRQFHELRTVLPALGAYARAPTPARAQVASRAVERMEVKERVMSDLVDSVDAPVPLQNAQLVLGEAFHSEDGLLTILIYDIVHRPIARVEREGHQFSVLIRSNVRTWRNAVLRYASARRLVVPAWLRPVGGAGQAGLTA